MLHLNLFGLRIAIACEDPAMRALIGANFSAFAATPSPAETPDLAYTVNHDVRGLTLRRGVAETANLWPGLDAGELIFLLEKDLTIEAQKHRPDLYFMHAAALSYRDGAFLLIGRSGSGKSTTCWGLLHHGCGYLSDELAPIDLNGYLVQPYPHALCLKSAPDAPYALPHGTLDTPPTLHIGVSDLPAPVITRPLPLRTIIHVQHAGRDRPPSIDELSAAEAGMLVYANALNPLCHSSDGLDAALDMARHCRTLRLTTGALDSSVDALLAALDA